MTPDHKRWVILDLQMWGYCTLPDDEDPATLLPLEWDSRAGAEAWLQSCYRRWSTWEQQGAPPGSEVPTGWRPHKDAPSPWEREPNRTWTGET
ncbi:hypothetical protein GCM10023084_33630 [Streptomyces lacrimifluminis]|uniref:Uncharacterized protein n=1 Tax=Streptomyces lacrimifluminis TaxID=1500077 RepID=A0A917NV39_9ACTN|nr:hypothetical protein GCM10012282_30060 [Streptomyces lacrimifluminis]